jgi:beta-aspartyl-peptidase (threonine type)
VRHLHSTLLLLLAIAVPLLRAQAPDDPGQRGAGNGPPRRSRTILVIHGGAGALTPKEMKEAGQVRGDYEAVLKEALTAGYLALKREGKTEVDAVEAVIRVLEDSELFNAGRGAALNRDGRAELDAALMEGRGEGRGVGTADPRKRAGAVTGLFHVKNPISAARAVMEMPGGQNVLLAGEGAERFALREENRRRYRIEEVSNVYFWTDRTLREIRAVVGDQQGGAAARGRASRPEGGRGGTGPGLDRRFGTVGAVALHGQGRLAAGTSTGGLTGKLPGRVGDTPVIGAGTYADDRACGVSCTGTGEVFIRHAVAHDVVARMLYGGLSVEKAARQAVDELPDEKGGVGGLIALDKEGRHAFAMSPLSVGMYRGYVTEEGEVFVGIYRDEGEKSLGNAEGPKDDAKAAPPAPRKIRPEVRERQ